MRRNKQARKVIAEAADVIERDGLAKGELGWTDGPKCILGAVYFVTTGSVKGYSRDPKVENLQHEVLGILGNAASARGSIGTIRFSDTHTADEVVAFLRAVAK